MNEVLIYGGINDYSAANAIEQINSYGDEDIVVRINTSGGSPEAAAGIIAKMQERKDKTKVRIDGKAYSMGAFMAAFSGDVTALDVSEFMFHRAAYPQWYEADGMTEAEAKNLKSINDNMRKALEAKVDSKKFQEVTGVKIKDMFSMDDRIDVFFNAKDAKRMGLVNKIEKITPQKRAELNSHVARLAASGENPEGLMIPTNAKPQESQSKPAEPNEDKTKISIMNLQELQAKYPELCAQIHAKGRQEGVDATIDAAGSWLPFNHLDPKAVAEGIKSGKPITHAAMSEFVLKQATAGAAGTVQEETNGDPIQTEEPETPVSAEAKEVADINAKMEKALEARKLLTPKS